MWRFVLRCCRLCGVPSTRPFSPAAWHWRIPRGSTERGVDAACRGTDRLAGARLAAMARAAAGRHLRGDGPVAALARGRTEAAVEGRRIGPRLVIADCRGRAAVHHRRRGRRADRVRLRPPGKAALRVANGAAWNGAYPGVARLVPIPKAACTTSTAHGRVACLEPVSGKEQWTVNILERFSPRTSRGHSASACWWTARAL